MANIAEAGQAVRLYQGQPGTANSVLYTSTDQVRIIVRSIVYATGAAADTLTLTAGANGSAASGAIVNGIVYAITTTTVLTPDVVLNNGDTITGSQTNATSGTLTIMGEFVN